MSTAKRRPVRLRGAVDQGADRLLQAVELGGGPRAQLVHHRAQVGEHGLGERADLVGDAPYLLRGYGIAARAEHLHRLGLHADGEHLLDDRVVQVAGDPLALLAARLVALPLQQRGVVDGDRRLLGHRAEELQPPLGDRLARGEEHVEHAGRGAADLERDARERVPLQLAQVGAQRIPAGVGLDLPPSVGHHDRPAGAHRVEHAQRRAPSVAVEQAVEEVRQVREPGGAHDAQVPAGLVEGEDLHPGELVGLPYLGGERVE